MKFSEFFTVANDDPTKIMIKEMPDRNRLGIDAETTGDVTKAIAKFSDTVAIVLVDKNDPGE